MIEISIHALLAESDPAIDVFLAVWAIISIHALLAESDVSFMLYDTSSLIFLSTLSLRRATNINSSVNTADKISIHALLAESDLRGCPASSRRRYFYPRSPCGERQ